MRFSRPHALEPGAGFGDRPHRDGATPELVPCFRTTTLPLEGCPIPGDVVAGTPSSRFREGFRSEDERLVSGVWECTEGSFAIRFGFDELVHVLEGEVYVRGPERPFVLRAGDVAFFPRGYEAVWEIPRYVRKLWVHRHHEVGVIERVRRAVALRTRARRLLTKLRGLEVTSA